MQHALKNVTREFKDGREQNAVQFITEFHKSKATHFYVQLRVYKHGDSERHH